MKKSDLVIHPKRMKGDDGYKTFSVRLNEELVCQLEALAAQTGHSRNELIGLLLSYGIDHCTVADK